MSTIIPVVPATTGKGSRHLDVHPDPNGEVQVTIRVDNISHILSAYGIAGVKAAVATVDLVLDQLRNEGCRVSSSRPGQADISFGHRSLPEAAEIMEVVVAQLSGDPIRLGDLHFHLALTCPMPGRGEAMLSAHVPPGCEPASEDEEWIEDFHGDMLIAGDVFAAMTDGRLQTGWQPIVAADDPGHVFYQEGLARMVGAEGEPLSPALFVPALERLGLVRAFDRQMVAIVLDELEAFPDAVLGVNISSKSVRFDGWWASLFARLQRRDVARRLVVEITETATLPAEAPTFVAALRKLGCRVALDDFGMGHASVRNALALCPDIVKIDAFFLRNACLSAQNDAMLEHLIGIAGNVAPTVIVEGVETAEQSLHAEELQARLAARSAACWQQGHHFGQPSYWRSWRHRHGEPAVIPPSELAARLPGPFRRSFPIMSQGRA